jgi:hypothetical protein
MLPIPPDLLAGYDESLSRNATPSYQQPHYRKWLRFYPDFCNKYDRPALDRSSVRAFLDELAGRNQAEWMPDQAIDAVRPYIVETEGVGQRQPPAGASDRGPAGNQPSAPLGDQRARSGLSER